MKDKARFLFRASRFRHGNERKFFAILVNILRLLKISSRCGRETGRARDTGLVSTKIDNSISRTEDDHRRRAARELISNDENFVSGSALYSRSSDNAREDGHDHIIHRVPISGADQSITST